MERGYVEGIITGYLNGVISLPEVAGEFHEIELVRYIDSKPENRFKFTLRVDGETMSLGKIVRRETAERAFDLALVFYARAQRENPHNPGEVQGWIEGRLASTHHYMGRIRKRLEKLEEWYPELFSAN